MANKLGEILSAHRTRASGNRPICNSVKWITFLWIIEYQQERLTPGGLGEQSLTCLTSGSALVSRNPATTKHLT